MLKIWKNIKQIGYIFHFVFFLTTKEDAKMETTLICLIVQYKRGEKDAFLGICEKMSPLIIKYARILKFYEMDDMKSELVLALLECVERMEKYSNEQEVLYYIKRAVQFKFHELYRSSKRQMNEVNLESEDNEFIDILFRYYPNDFEDVLYRIDMNTYIEGLPKKKQDIAKKVLLSRLSDAEIGEELHVTRQYVYRIRKEIYKKLGKSYI